jgi:Tfp pilus assembly protein PilE
MGQQQLLLIVLGVIIVGIAVVVGINVFTASSTSSNKDAIVSDLTNLAASAQQYYRKPIALGGGGNSFTNYTIPTQLDSTANGTYTISTPGNATSIAFRGATLTGASAAGTAIMTVTKDGPSGTVFTGF